jgi:hypothetical protein
MSESEKKFTPAPWTVGDHDRNEQRQVVAGGVLVAVVAHECINAREPEMEANARLIAAAPALLAALEGLLNEWGGIDARPETHPAAIEARAAVLAAHGGGGK